MACMPGGNGDPLTNEKGKGGALVPSAAMKGPAKVDGRLVVAGALVVLFLLGIPPLTPALVLRGAEVSWESAPLLAAGAARVLALCPIESMGSGSCTASCPEDMSLPTCSSAPLELCPTISSWRMFLSCESWKEVLSKLVLRRDSRTPLPSPECCRGTRACQPNAGPLLRQETQEGFWTGRSYSQTARQGLP